MVESDVRGSRPSGLIWRRAGSCATCAGQRLSRTRMASRMAREAASSPMGWQVMVTRCPAEVMDAVMTTRSRAVEP